MKNIPRIFIETPIKTGDVIPATRDTAHYLTRVMRTNDFLAFNNGVEYAAVLAPDGKSIAIGDATEHADPTGDITLMFAPIKRTDDLINMVTQMGVARFQPVITARTNASHINWDRMRKIAVEAAEQSNRNSVPEILPVIKFSDLDLSGVVFADERAAHGANAADTISAKSVLIGPEGGFSSEEFNALDAAGAHGISLGTTILRAELAAAIAISRISMK
ncbi:MAG: 16S rRNA (uracil(1498)-N(3))-methyltransferase [Alphaproteobacteria bacterium]|nr:16S rRNA (uracil(1498)-N(3))-methyltransferase [Alphaproteobacteria bacterium]